METNKQQPETGRYVGENKTIQHPYNLFVLDRV
jgi:hypothetical protein